MGKLKTKSSPWSALEWITHVFVGLAFSLFILFTPAYTAMGQVKYTLFCWFFGIYALLLVLLPLEGVLTGSLSFSDLGRKLRPRSICQYSILAYLLLTVVSALLSEYPQIVWRGEARKEGVWTIGLYVIAFYGVAKFFRGGRWILYVLGGTTLLFSILSIVQLMGYNPFLLYPQGYSYYDAYEAYSGAFIGTIGNVDLAAAFLCLSVGALWIYIFKGKERIRYILLLPLVLALFVLLRIQVLAGVVGICVGTVFMIPYVLGLSKKHRLWYFIGLGVFAVAGVLVLYLWDAKEGFFHEIHMILRGRISDGFGTGRIYIWKNVLRKVPENLFFGAGPDTLLYSGIEPFRRYDEGLKMDLTAYVDVAHSEYLNILYHQGIFAFLAYLLGMFDIIRRGIKNVGRNPYIAVWSGSVVCYVLQGAFGISQYLITPVFWVCLGLLEYFVSGSDSPVPETKRRKPYEKTNH